MPKKFDIVVEGLDQEFSVHKHGCRDVKRAMRSGANNFYTVEADSAMEAVVDEVAEYQHNRQNWTADDFRIMPCCGE